MPLMRKYKELQHERLTIEAWRGKTVVSLASEEAMPSTDKNLPIAMQGSRGFQVTDPGNGLFASI
jgi:hypothetical protein